MARVATIDLPGLGGTLGPRSALDARGLSSAPADWLRRTGREGAVLVVSSAGCQVVADLASHTGGLLGPVVFLGPTVDRSARSAIRQLRRLLLDIPRERLSLIPLVAADYLRCGPRRIAGTARCLLADDVEHKPHHLRTATVVIRGERDPLVPRAWAREVAAPLPRGRLVELCGAGHAVHHGAPEAVALLVRALFPGARA
ncbi:pimeloyl-ACP methyl ester carboxylesterase [Actinokineospora auranticolor]|uniref:Pimeloyl-ACP methyl ester carboxylesterase n=1 Tax=Actinokineospora auranticolor TaxID=155976 RepID=A0A2S6GIE2_9PSEU|nr:alpha/beta hydrolase [Actinokineospora auranticolor]PPK64989.1 pimeloyl-ACP methyl ester carboxylesterase [Actinokineospora auranticolor]